jgi:hypothetical protein
MVSRHARWPDASARSSEFESFTHLFATANRIKSAARGTAYAETFPGDRARLIYRLEPDSPFRSKTYLKAVSERHCGHCFVHPLFCIAIEEPDLQCFG